MLHKTQAQLLEQLAAVQRQLEAQTGQLAEARAAAAAAQQDAVAAAAGREEAEAAAEAARAALAKARRDQEGERERVKKAMGDMKRKIDRYAIRTHQRVHSTSGYAMLSRVWNNAMPRRFRDQNVRAVLLLCRALRAPLLLPGIGCKAKCFFQCCCSTLNILTFLSPTSGLPRPTITHCCLLRLLVAEGLLARLLASRPLKS